MALVDNKWEQNQISPSLQGNDGLCVELYECASELPMPFTEGSNDTKAHYSVS